jgi:hypothetical protein
MQTAGNVFRQSTVSPISSHKFISKVSTKVFLYPFAYFLFLFIINLLFLFILTVCQDKNVNVELTGQEDHSLLASTNIVPEEPFALANPDDSAYPILPIPAESLAELPFIVASPRLVSRHLSLSGKRMY